jgi:RimJ/RimL family protein N-acetyltransferase
VVTTERLRLPLWTAEETADIRAGRHRAHWHPDYPRPEDRDAATLWRDGDPWGPRHLVRGSTVLGSLGFFGPPTAPPTAPDGAPDGAADGAPDGAPDGDSGAPPEAEVGYGLVAEARGWGFATEALRAVLVETDRLGVRVRASVAPENRASIRVLAKCGFTELRGADEDGHLVMARPLPPAARG